MGNQDWGGPEAWPVPWPLEEPSEPEEPETPREDEGTIGDDGEREASVEAPCRPEKRRGGPEGTAPA
jgi:hypothetical protein